MTPEPHGNADANASVLVSLDLEIVRAQMVNCLLMANGLFQKNNPGLSTALVFGRVSDLGVLFTMMSNQGEPRLYLFRLLNPDGTSAHLSKLDAQGSQLELDAFDQAYIQSISASLASTVAAAYGQMVQQTVMPTHPGVPTLQ